MIVLHYTLLFIIIEFYIYYLPMKERYKEKRSICFHYKSKKVKFKCLDYDKYIHKECFENHIKNI
jgi:hypothetical protein